MKGRKASTDDDSHPSVALLWRSAPPASRRFVPPSHLRSGVHWVHQNGLRRGRNAPTVVVAVTGREEVLVFCIHGCDKFLDQWSW